MPQPASLTAVRVAALLALALPARAGAPPVCDAGGGTGGYHVALGVPVTQAQLDGRRSSDRDPGTTLRFRWELLSGTGSFDDATSATPTLSLATPDRCVVYRAAVKLTVSDGDFDVSCFTSVEAAERRSCPLHLVALMDTSSSMFDDGAALCANLASVVSDLRTQGIEIEAELLGITNTGPSSVFTCLSSDAKRLFGDPRVDQSEDWGPATSVVAERMAWKADHVRLVVPLSDEAPEDGDPCFDPGNDRDAIARAATAANANHILVSPIAAQGASSATIRLGRDLAVATRGTHFASASAADIADALRSLAEKACGVARPVTCRIAPVPTASCAGTKTELALDGSGSSVSCASGGMLWTSDCPGATFDDPTSPRPTLSIDAAGHGCNLDCNVRLLVAEGSRTASCTETVRVRDDGPPRLAAPRFDGACLWPPNHKYVCFNDIAAEVTAEDCAAIALRVVGCRSDQPDDAPDGPPRSANGDGHTSQDCTIHEDGRGFCVRAERLGGDPAGRHYAVTVEAADACGNASRSTATLHVPHDQAPGEKDCLAAGSSR